MNNKELYKQIPSVDDIINNLPEELLLLHRNLIKQVIRNSISDIKKQIADEKLDSNISSYLIDLILKRLKKNSSPHLSKVINGTGIILHTGLGRAPISKKIFSKALESVYPYTNLEFDLSNGKRGERNHHVDYLINSITGCESSIVVNNNAAAVLLTLNTLAENEKVIISRGQQVEIGGSFRIPDVINKSNCKMVEVGTTNKTHLKDYQEVAQDNSGLILYAHTSNYKVVGFTEEVSLVDLAKLSNKKRIPLVVDLGSGALIDFSKMNLPFENLVSHYIKSGSSIVTFSGDKLIGGPQCGIICGKKKLIKQIKSNPLYRVLRCDKFTLSLLEHSLKTFLSDSKINSENMTISLLNRDKIKLKNMGNKILSRIDKKLIKANNIKLIQSKVEAGSGSLPTQNIESYAISIDSNISATKLSRLFRSATTPLIGYIHKSIFFIDLKAIPNDQVNLVSNMIIEILS